MNTFFRTLSLLFFPLLLTTGVFGQTDFYRMDSVQTIEITFTQTNWDYMLDTAASGSEGYIIAQSVAINGQVFDSVGVKYKGNSSYNANQVKNPLHIELDHVRSNQAYQGYSDIKLSNGYKDPSFCREVMAYSFLRDYMVAPLSNHAWLRINGADIGLYSSSEHIGNKFVEKYFGSSDQAFFKCNPLGGFGPGSTSGSPTLEYLGPDSSLYLDRYELKSDYGWNALVSFCDSLVNNPSSIPNIVDVDRALWMLAFNNVLVNLDSYSGGSSQNYYLYRDGTRRFNPIIWDLNESFGCFANSGTGNLSITQEQQLSPYIHETNSARPLIQKLLANPEYKRRYMAHLRTIVNEHFANGEYMTRIQAQQAFLQPYVNADPNKLYTYSQFQSSLTSSVNAMGGQIPGIQVLMGGRTTWLQTQAAFSATPPDLGTVAIDPVNPEAGSLVNIHCQATGATLVRLGYRDAGSLRFTYAQMVDDGFHSDGQAGDGIFGISIPVTAARMEYYVYAENGNAGIFSPARAEHEFYALTATLLTPGPGEIVLNEFMAVNQNDTTDAEGEHEDWIELKNLTSSILGLEGLYLSDDSTVLAKWAFPAGLTIPANGYLFIWADQDTSTSGIHAGIKLSASGEVIILSDQNGTILDQISFGAQTIDQSMGRCPDGTGPWAGTFQTTPGYGNNCTAGLNQPDRGAEWTVWPNPASDQLLMASPDGTPVGAFRLYDLSGRTLLSGSSPASSAELNLSDLSEGLYFLERVGYRHPQKIVVRH